MTTGSHSEEQRSSNSQLTTRAWDNVNKGGPNDCWLWTGPTYARSGYGRINLPGKSGTTAHRFIWSVLFGIPHSDLEICHTCDNRLCCNPGHLFAGTPKINAIDKVKKGRQARITGTRNGASKLTPEIVRDIKLSTEQGRTLAKRYGVNETNISHIRLGRTWTHVKV